jgi:hypothetical protein
MYFYIAGKQDGGSTNQVFPMAIYTPMTFLLPIILQSLAIPLEINVKYYLLLGTILITSSTWSINRLAVNCNLKYYTR